MCYSLIHKLDHGIIETYELAENMEHGNACFVWLQFVIKPSVCFSHVTFNLHTGNYYLTDGQTLKISSISMKELVAIKSHMTWQSLEHRLIMGMSSKDDNHNSHNFLDITPIIMCNVWQLRYLANHMQCFK